MSSTAPTFPAECKAGRFRFSILTVRQKIQARRIASEIWGGALPTDDESLEYGLVWALAEMQAAAVETPKEWNWKALIDTEDGTPINDLWEAYVTARDSFRPNVEKAG